MEPFWLSQRFSSWRIFRKKQCLQRGSVRFLLVVLSQLHVFCCGFTIYGTFWVLSDSVFYISIFYIFFSIFILIFAAVRSGVQRPDYIPTTLSGLVWFSELTAVSCSVFYSIMQCIAVHYNVVYSNFTAVN